MMEIFYGEYLISDDQSRIQPDVVIDLLSRSYWAAKRPHERTKNAIKNSYCVGVYHRDRQVGFARIVTDDATIFYLCDVIIDEDHRSNGLGKKLIEAIMNAERFEGMMGLLGTLDAHGLYEKYGFIRDADRFMKRPPHWASQPNDR